MSRVAAMAAVLLVGLAVSPGIVQGFDLPTFLGTVVNKFAEELFVNREITLFDRYCTLSRRPIIHRWELKYRAQVSCPGWTPIVGKAKNWLNPTTAETKATQDFVRQALERNLVTTEEASEWLQ